MTAVEINLKGLQAGLVPKAAHVLCHLRWGALPYRPFGPSGRTSCATRDVAKIHPEAHASGRHILPSMLDTGLTQVSLAGAQIRQRHGGRLPHLGKLRGSTQGRMAGSANPDGWMRLLQRFGLCIHVIKGKEPSVKCHWIRCPKGLTDAEVLGRACPEVEEGEHGGGKFGLQPTGPLG